MSTLSGFSIISWGIGLIALGAFAVVYWAYIHQEADDQDDRRRTKVIKKIEDELDCLKKD